MQKAIPLLLIIATLTIATRGQQRVDPPWIKDLIGKGLVYRVPGMESVTVKKNVIYKRVAAQELLMDIYSPRAAQQKVPAVLFIHGGRVPANLLTTPKDWTVYIQFGQLVAASGFVGVTFNHRFHTWESLADSQNDVMDAIKYIRENAASLGVDQDRIVLWAVSAGGILLSQPLRERPPYISKIIAYYSVMDMRGDRAPATVPTETLRDFSPAYWLEQARSQQPASLPPSAASAQPPTVSQPLFPPILIARAGRDSPALNAGLDRFAQLALQNNISLELLNHATGRHGFDIEDNNDRSREILKRTIEFLKQP